MKRLHLREEGLCTDPAPKKHKTQSLSNYPGITKPNVWYSAGIYDPESENTGAMEVEEEDELDGDAGATEIETAEEELG
jgi:hypothetical protein